MYHKIIIIGNLGRDPEMRYTPDGTPVTTLSVASTTKRGDGEETAWFRVTAWRRQAEVAAQYLSKGRQVMVEGRLRPDPATGGPRLYQRNDGSWGAQYEVTADRILFLGGGRREEDEGESDEIPF